MFLPLKNEFLKMYLEYVEDTESPRIMHIWSILACVSAALGRRNYLPFGIGPIYPNMYVLLVGPPGVRKSTALQIASKFVKLNTQVKFAPDDTAGQRQGLISALTQKDLTDEENFQKQLDKDYNFTVEGLTKEVLGNLEINVNPQDINTMFISASEFSTFSGINNLDLLNFLGKLWDGEDYQYTLRKESDIIKAPLLNLLGCSTATTIAKTFPEAAIGQGFMSRIILVHDSVKYKKVPRPKRLPSSIADQISAVFNTIYFSFSGEFKESTEAAVYLETLYEKTSHIEDHRFIYYIERRQSHLVKVAMNLAACRLSQIIELQDVKDADLLLKYTELAMPDALGEYGLAPLAAVKQKLVEFLTRAKEPITSATLWAMMHRELPQKDFNGVLSDLVNANKVRVVSTAAGAAYVAITKTDEKTLKAIDALIREANSDEPKNLHKMPNEEIH